MLSVILHYCLPFIVSFSVIIILICLVKMHRFHKTYFRQRESREARYQIICEYSRIRHEYNNILQTITNLIEVQDFEELAQFKSILLEKVHDINYNSITQLGKIKADTVLNPVHKLYMQSTKDNIKLHITVYKEIMRECPYEEDLYNILEECLGTAFRMTEPESPEINLEIGESDQDLFFYFDSKQKPDVEHIVMKAQNFEGTKLGKKIIYNTYYKNDNYVQELKIGISQ